MVFPYKLVSEASGELLEVQIPALHLETSHLGFQHESPQGGAEGSVHSPLGDSGMQPSEGPLSTLNCWEIPHSCLVIWPGVTSLFLLCRPPPSAC